MLPKHQNRQTLPTKVERRPPLVLIIEDDRDTRDMYAEALRFYGLPVLACATAQDAFNEADRLLPDIVVTDIGLPGDMDGCRLTEALKKNTRTRHIPVLAVTAWAIGGQPERARAAGCDVVLIKPVLPADLLAAVQRLLKLART